MEYYTHVEVMKLCNCSKGKAYNIIRALNDLQISRGIPKDCLISGKVSKKFLEETLTIRMKNKGE